MQWIIRFILGGVIVSLFSLTGDVIRPRGFAGLFGAAPSVALATLTLTVMTDGKSYAADEARSMAVGAVALLAYVLACLYLMAKGHLRAPVATLAMLPCWGLGAWALWALALR